MKRPLWVLVILLAGCSSQPTVVAEDNGPLPDVESPADDGGTGPEEALDDRVPEDGDAALADDPPASDLPASDPPANDPAVDAPSTGDIAVDDAVTETADLVEVEVPALDALPDADIDACMPECGEAVCGDDGCGGTCGECTGGKVCADGICECMERAYRACCDNAVCWFDSCGTEGLWIVDCPKGCEASRCVDCTSQCAGKACGEDGCGGECGQCAAGQCEGLEWTMPGACVNGQCREGGALQSCDDGVVCTRDRCDPRSGCRHDVRADGYICEAGRCEALTWWRPRTCASGACAGGGGTESCLDENLCTDDACSAESGCLFTPNTMACDDGDPCTVTDACANGVCVGTGANDCSDNNDCTTDSCAKGVGCQHENIMDGAACGATSCNGLTWTKPGACQAGTCMPTGIQGCDDSLPCTTDACDATSGCSNVLHAGNCLVGGACYASGDPGGTCLVCEPGLNTTAFTPMSGNACEDGDACTTDDVCVADDTPGCKGTAYSCDDGLTCTTDACDSKGGCANTLQAGFCRIDSKCWGEGQQNGANPCLGCAVMTSATSWTPAADGATCAASTCSGLDFTSPKSCVSGACTGGGGATNCDDGNVCTTDACSASGCSNALQSGYCLIPGIGCVAGGAAKAGDPCQVCTPAKSTTGWGPAADGSQCVAGSCNGLTWTKPNLCAAGVCSTVGGTRSCDDGLSCTLDSCAATGCTNMLQAGTCLIGGACYADGQSAADPCKVCTVASSTTIWSNAANGKNCGTDSVCNSGSCCVRQCGGKACGDDGCGGTCGTCPSDKNCRSGQCVGLICGSVTCPEVSGYTVTCNAQAHCEYANPDTTGWKHWDVWVHVPAGSFTMGSPSGESGHSSTEDPNHVVTFAKGYLIGKYLVTVAEYEACRSASPSTCTAPSTADWDGNGWGTNTSGNGRSAHPQNGLTWDQAGAVCAWLGGRRPSEAEWEYAATGPTHRKYPWGDSPSPTCAANVAVYDEDGAGGRPWGCNSCTSSGCSGTSPVGSKAAGASWSGTLDMAGNVWQWVEDWYHSTYSGAPSDGSAWVSPSSSQRVFRGGSFINDAGYLRSSYRFYDYPSVRYAGRGARCLRPLP